MRLLLFNLATDADDPVLGFTTVWINAMAERCDHIDVLTMRAGRLAVADNVRVYSVGAEKGYSEPRRALNFYRYLSMLLRQNRYDACFAHMQPLFAIMGWPLLRLARVPITMWYAHKSVTPKLKLAEKLVDHVVTSSPEGFRVPSQKVIIVGQGINTVHFSPAAQRHERPFTLVSVSRVAPVKRIETAIEAAHLLKQAGIDFCLRIVGEAESTDYLQRLQRLVAQHNLTEQVEFVGGLPYDHIPDVYRAADVMVNISSTGSVDKAVLEAMACGLPVMTANEAFIPILLDWEDLLLIPPNAPQILTQRLQRLAEMPVDERHALGALLRQIVVEQHSLDRLSWQLLRVMNNRHVS